MTVKDMLPLSMADGKGVQELLGFVKPGVQREAAVNIALRNISPVVCVFDFNSSGDDGWGQNPPRIWL